MFCYIISTGRCGTQWLASALNQVYGDSAVIEHEPLGYAYQPKITLRSPERLASLASTVPLSEHLAYIDHVLINKPYIECGNQAFAAVPLFIERYGSHMRLIHLIRHPVNMAISHLTVNSYQRKENDPWRQCELEPGDAGTVYKQYKTRWTQLSSYEKCLYQWLEVNTWAEELKQKYPHVPLLTIRMEDLFSRQGAVILDRILVLIGLPNNPSLYRLLSEHVDNMDKKSFFDDFKWQSVNHHPHVINLARYYNYDFESLNEKQLRKRYQGSFCRRLRMRWKAWKKRRKCHK